MESKNCYCHMPPLHSVSSVQARCTQLLLGPFLPWDVGGKHQGFYFAEQFMNKTRHDLQGCRAWTR